MQFPSNNYARSLGLSATFLGEICDPEDASVGIKGNHGYIIKAQIVGDKSPDTPNANFLALSQAITAAYEFWEDDFFKYSEELEQEFDELCELLFSDDYPDMEPDYEPESGDFLFFYSEINE